MAAVLSVLIKEWTMAIWCLMHRYFHSWLGFPLAVHIKMGKLNTSMAHLVSWSLFSILLAFPQHTGSAALIHAVYLKIASGTLFFASVYNTLLLKSWNGSPPDLSHLRHTGSAALVHAVYLKIASGTLFFASVYNTLLLKSWNGSPPDLSHLRVFGSLITYSWCSPC